MIRHPIGLHLAADPSRSIKERVREAAALGAVGVVLDAAGDLNPDRLSETGRRELRHLLRSTELTLFGLVLPTRRPFDTQDQLDDRLDRAERAFALAFDLGTRLVLARVGAVPDDSPATATRRSAFTVALGELDRRADRRGVAFAVESGPEPAATLRAFLDATGSPALAACLDPSAHLDRGEDPAQAARDLGPRVVHSWAADRRGFAWEDYLGALEEIGYRGPLTCRPDPDRPIAPQFQALTALLARF
jgi:sugar phosphate isomerase/epimerase